MILGIGTDIVEIERIRKAVGRWGDHFLNKIFTPHEIAYCMKRKDPYPCLSARFAAKEGVIKAVSALDDLPGVLSFRDIEIYNEPSGRPIVRIINPNFDKCLADAVLHLSLSHERGHALAFVVLERKKP